jgi:epoxyqueuosine reductase
VDLATALRSAAARHGLCGFGIASAAPFRQTRRVMTERKEGGRHGGVRFTYRDPIVATDPRASFPWAERLVVGAWGYLPTAGSPGPPRPGTGRVARFATGDHYAPLRAALEALAGGLRGAGHRAEVLCDDARLVDRAAAVRAGTGWWGKSTMVLCPGHGPWVLLGSVLTDAPLAESPPMVRDCGTCIACLPACPTGALVAPGVLDARRCLAHLAQSAGGIPPEYRRAMGDRLYGCDACLEACPPGRRRLAAAGGGEGRVDLAALLAADDATLRRRFGHFYLPGRRIRYLRRNALVALGNAGGERAVEVAGAYLRHEDPLLRAHAAWALGALGGPGARARLAAAAREADPAEREEIEQAGREAGPGVGDGGARRGGTVP